jgi:uncharacterized membrane protein (UPF0127 family)
MVGNFCVFNQTRESFLGLRVLQADTMYSRLRGLLGRMKFAPEDGLWLTPSFGIHTFGMLFPVDVVYLDDARRVTHLVEHLAPFRFSPIRPECAGLLELRTRTIYSSHTKVGDQMLICPPEEMQIHLEKQHTASGTMKEKEGHRVQEFHSRPETMAGGRNAKCPSRSPVR